jgi:hypothetical protein
VHKDEPPWSHLQPAPRGCKPCHPLKEIDGLRMERGVLSPSRPLLTRSVLPIPFLERLSAGDGARLRPNPFQASRLARDSRSECTYRAPADRGPDAWGAIPAGTQSSLGPWRQAPEVSAHVVRLLPRVGGLPPRTSLPPGRMPMSLARAGSPPAGRHSHWDLAAIIRTLMFKTGPAWESWGRGRFREGGCAPLGLAAWDSRRRRRLSSPSLTTR